MSKYRYEGNFICVHILFLVNIYLSYISMKKSKIIISETILDRVAQSEIISEAEKLRLLKYVGYMSYDEQQELCTLI